MASNILIVAFKHLKNIKTVNHFMLYNLPPFLFVCFGFLSNCFLGFLYFLAITFFFIPVHFSLVLSKSSSYILYFFIFSFSPFVRTFSSTSFLLLSLKFNFSLHKSFLSYFLFLSSFLLILHFLSLFIL